MANEQNKDFRLEQMFSACFCEQETESKLYHYLINRDKTIPKNSLKQTMRAYFPLKMYLETGISEEIMNIIYGIALDYYEPQNKEQLDNLTISIIANEAASNLNEEKIILDCLKNSLSIKKYLLWLKTLNFTMNELIETITSPFTIETDQEISQNPNSLDVLFNSCFYENPSACFYNLLINKFQELELNKTYKCYTESLVTYCLKLLQRHGIIKITSYSKGHLYNLQIYQDVYAKNQKPNRQMYRLEFIKLRNLSLEDLPLLTSLANILKIDLNIFDITNNNSKELHLKLKKE